MHTSVSLLVEWLLDDKVRFQVDEENEHVAGVIMWPRRSTNFPRRRALLAARSPVFVAMADRITSVAPLPAVLEEEPCNDCLQQRITDKRIN